MAPIYDRFMDDYRILDSQNRPVQDTFSHTMMWLENPGCILQPGHFQLPVDLRTHGIMKPGLYMTIVLEGKGQSYTRDGPEKVRYSKNSLLGMAVREPTPCSGEAPIGPIRAVGVVFPFSSLAALGLEDEFHNLFAATERPLVVFDVKAPPRVQAIAEEILSPALNGAPGKLLMRAQAMEILARSLEALRYTELSKPIDSKRARIQLAKDMMDVDLQLPWTVAELAQRVGISRRSLSMTFQSTYGVSVITYLRVKRLEIAREAIVFQNMTVMEASALVGYSSPENFATAFRKHFGSVPSAFRK